MSVISSIAKHTAAFPVGKIPVEKTQKILESLGEASAAFPVGLLA